MQDSVPPASTASACAALDHLGGLADGVRAGGARRDDRVVRAFDAERDRELSGDGVDEHVLQEVRRDAVRAALAQRVGLLEDAGYAADRRAEDDPDAGRVEAVQPGVCERLATGGRRRRARCARASAPPSARRPGSGRSPSPRRRPAPAGRRCRTCEIQSMPLSPASAARQVDGRVEPERCHRADARDGNTSHRASVDESFDSTKSGQVAGQAAPSPCARNRSTFVRRGI